jgi:transposase-like protein
MVTTIKRQHTPEFKTTVVLDILKQEETISQICSKYSIHPTQAKMWKAKALEILKSGFSGQSIGEQIKNRDSLIEELYKQIGQLKVELDWLKKKLGLIAR